MHAWRRTNPVALYGRVVGFTLAGAGLLSAQEPLPPGDVGEPAIPVAEPPEIRDLIEALLGAPIRGEFSNRYRHRRIAGETDEDVIQFLRLGVGDEGATPWSFDLAARSSEDLDGNRHTSGFYPFDEISNSFGRAVNVRLYTAALTGRGVGGLDRVRLGRQEVIGAEPLYFDGLRLDGPALAALADLRIRVYGGIPVHLYESPVDGDGVGGVDVEVQPFTATRLFAQYAHIADRFSLYGRARTNLESVRWQQQWAPALSTEARATVIDSRGREAALSAAWRPPGDDFFAQAGYRRLMEEQTAFAIDVDPYVGILMKQEPYHQWDARLSKGVASWLTLSADGSGRLLVNEREESEFNREFSRLSIVPVLTGWPEPGTVWTLTVTAWEAEETRLVSYAGEVAHPLIPDVTVRTGTDYALYKFDLFSDRERTHARTVFLKLRWSQTKDTRWDAGYELERSDLDTFGKFEIAVRYQF